MLNASFLANVLSFRHQSTRFDVLQPYNIIWVKLQRSLYFYQKLNWHKRFSIACKYTIQVWAILLLDSASRNLLLVNTREYFHKVFGIGQKCSHLIKTIVVCQYVSIGKSTVLCASHQSKQLKCKTESLLRTIIIKNIHIMMNYYLPKVWFQSCFDANHLSCDVKDNVLRL